MFTVIPNDLEITSEAKTGKIRIDVKKNKEEKSEGWNLCRMNLRKMNVIPSIVVVAARDLITPAWTPIDNPIPKIPIMN
jgi:hypothetical protein